MQNLPEEIIADILCRLPAKILLRFRCVSKQWRLMLDGKDFSKLHLHQTMKSNDHRFLFVKDSFSDLFSVDLDSLKRLDHGAPPFEYYCLANSCNGLVLASSDGPILWNPSTRKYKILPPTPREFPQDKKVSVVEMFGLGYDSKTDDYKVVRVSEIRDGKSCDYMYSETKIYSLKSNSWKRVEDFPYSLSCSKRVWGVYLNDALHTVVRFCHLHELIMGFDLGTAEHFQVPKPDLTGENVGVDSVEVIGGCLSALVPRKKNRSEIWVMKEYGVKQSWTKLLCFSPPMPEPYMSLIPLAYSKRGNEVYLNYDGRCLMAYNLRKKNTRIANVPGLLPQFYDIAYFGSRFYAEVCVDSLVSLDSPDEAREVQKENGQGKKGKKIKKRDDFLSVGFKLKL